MPLTDGIVEDEQVLGLVFLKGEDERGEHVAEVLHQFSARLLLQCRKRRTRSLLYSLVAVQDALQQLRKNKNIHAIYC